MTKKSNRQAVQYENQSGCMWGFINILDFRSRSTRKLLSDRKHWRFSQGNTSIKFGVLRNYNEDSQTTLGGEENNSMATAGTGKPSVKKLMEEDMFGEPDKNKGIRNVEIKVEDGSHMTKRQKRKKNKKSGNAQCHDINASGDLESQHSWHQDSEQQSINNLNIDAIVREFCSQIHQEIFSCEEHDLDEMKSNSKHCTSEEKLCEAVKLFLNQRCFSEEQFEEIEKFLNPEALKDALEILRTDKDLFLKLLQDSNSEWRKSSQNLKDVGEEKNENSKSNQEIVNPIKPELILHKKHNFFRRMVKSPDRNSLNRRQDSQASNRIVILKPGTAGMQNPETTLAGSNNITKNKDPSVRSVSYFSFSELKRRLKHAMGKEHHEVSSDVMFEENSSDYRNPVSGKGVLGENAGIHSPTKDHFFMERMVKPSMSTRMRDEARKSKDFEISMANDSEQRVSNIYIEAKKHISGMLSNGDEAESTSNRLVQKSLGRILSLSEYNTPSASPGREQGSSNFISTQTRLSISDNLETSNESTCGLEAENIIVQNMEDQKCSSGGNSCDSSLALDWDPNISDGVVHEDQKEIIIPAIDETSSGGDMEIIETTDDVAMDAPSEPVSSFITEQIGETPETFDGKGYSEGLQEDVYEEKQPQSSPLASPLRFSIANKVEDQKNDINIQDHRSPISVLELLYIEDEISCASTECPPEKFAVELPIQPLQIKFEEHESCDTDESIHLKPGRDEKESILEYVKAVLQGSGLDWDELYMRSLSSDRLLNPALLDEIEFFSNQLCHDKQLLFDCINEVVVEAYGQHFSCSQWVSFVKPSISPAPDMKNAIQGVWEGICWHLLPQPLPRTLDQIVGRDMAKSGAWMDLRFDVESIGIDIWEVIFEELMEDTIFGCVPYPAVQNEPVKDN